jgi:hypothetical protein
MTNKSFKQFLSEAATRKVFISHLDKMKPLEFLALVSKLDKKFKGVLSKNKLSITEKIDGSALRVGQDKDGNSFIESSTSASMFNVGDFVARDKSKGYSGEVGKKFDALLKGFKNDKKFQSVLSKFNDGTGIKVIGEILYTPMGIEDLDTTIKFIRIHYDKTKLGTEWTFVPFKVINDAGEEYSNTPEIKKAIYAISSKARKYVPPTLNISDDIDISIEIKEFQSNILGKYKDLDVLLSSRKHADRELKEKIKNEILKYQEMIAKKIISYVKSGVFGKDFEGMVIELPDGSVLKVVSDVFKANKFKPN